MFELSELFELFELFEFPLKIFTLMFNVKGMLPATGYNLHILNGDAGSVQL